MDLWKSQQAETEGKAGQIKDSQALFYPQLSSSLPQAPQAQLLLYVVVGLAQVK